MEESKFYRFVKPLIPRPLRPLVLKYQELVSYMVFGGLTTLVNLLIYFALNRFINYLIANVIAWTGSVIFAFFTNKAFVFQEARWDCRSLLRQGAAFALTRLLSLGVEEGLLLLFAELLQFNKIAVKILAQVIVVLLNYLASKLVIFRTKKK